MASFNDHPLPPPPGQQQTYQQQTSLQYSQQPPPQSQSQPGNPGPRSRGLSLQSGHSKKSSGSGKDNLVETHLEKENKRLHSKADPTMAMSEAEPSLIAAQAKHNLQNLRAMQHKDKFGNVITDPDQSNPTRWREERPLDTIKAFEAAIDGNYRSSMINAGDNESVMSWNRRSSYYGHGNTPRFQNENYHGSRPQSSFRPEANTPRDVYFEQQQGVPRGGWGPSPDRRRVPPRMGAEPMYNRQMGPNVYGAPNGQQSYETVASGSGTSGERPGYQTDPTSSDNSSIERRQSPPKQESTNDYGIGFSQAPEYQPSAFTVANSGPAHTGYQNGGGAPQSLPRKDGTTMRKPLNQEAEAEVESSGKRKSWLARRLSRNL